MELDKYYRIMVIAQTVSEISYSLSELKSEHMDINNIESALKKALINLEEMYTNLS